MEFLKERVYTALNADELKIGSKVIVAFTSGILKNNVLGGIGEGILQKVKSEFETARFVVDGASYSLAYLVSEPQLDLACQGFKNGYNKAKEEMQEQGLALQSDMDKTIEQNIALKEQIEKMKCCENCSKNGHICVAEEMQGKLCGKNKDKWELRR